MLRNVLNAFTADATINFSKAVVTHQPDRVFYIWMLFNRLGYFARLTGDSQAF